LWSRVTNVGKVLERFIVYASLAAVDQKLGLKKTGVGYGHLLKRKNLIYTA